jgi:thiaminase/transcriptional activator TenA
MAAILPCFWIYREVGNAVAAGAATDNSYARWIETYSSPEFSADVEKAVAFTEQLAADAGPAERTLMREAFMTASRLEYCFWDDAEYRRYLPV